jgi:hypothetical protein
MMVSVEREVAAAAAAVLVSVLMVRVHASVSQSIGPCARLHASV